MQPSDRDTLRNGLIPELEQIHDDETDHDKRDVLLKAVCIVEEHIRRQVTERVRTLRAEGESEQAEDL